MVKIVLEIKSCKDCPHFKQERMYTEDSFEYVYNWFCKKENGKEIESYVEWHEENKIKIPEWCPAKQDEKSINVTRIKDLPENIDWRSFKVVLPDIVYNESSLPLHGIENQPVHFRGWVMGDLFVKTEIHSDRIFPMFWTKIPPDISEWEVLYVD